MALQTAGAIVSLSAPQDGGNLWEANQVEQSLNLPPGDAHERQIIDWGFGPVKITGYVDTNTFETGVNVSVVGISTGNIFGNLKDGLGVKTNLFVAQGPIRLYLKNGNEIWVHLDVKVTFGGSYNQEFRIQRF